MPFRWIGHDEAPPPVSAVGHPALSIYTIDILYVNMHFLSVLVNFCLKFELPLSVLWFQYQVERCLKEVD